MRLPVSTWLWLMSDYPTTMFYGKSYMAILPGPTTTTMSRYHQSADDVPDGLRTPQWSWDGLEE